MRRDSLIFSVLKSLGSPITNGMMGSTAATANALATPACDSSLSSAHGTKDASAQDNAIQFIPLVDEAYVWNKHRVAKETRLVKLSSQGNAIDPEASAFGKVGSLVCESKGLAHPTLDRYSRYILEVFQFANCDLNFRGPVCIPVQILVAGQPCYLQLVLYKQTISINRNASLEDLFVKLVKSGFCSTDVASLDFVQKNLRHIIESTDFLDSIRSVFEGSSVLMSEPAIDEQSPAESAFTKPEDFDEIEFGLFTNVFTSNECNLLIHSKNDRVGLCFDLFQHKGSASYISAIYVEKGVSKVPIKVRVLELHEAAHLIEANMKYEAPLLCAR